MQHEMHVLGIAIAQHVLHAVGMDNRGKVTSRLQAARARALLDGTGATRPALPHAASGALCVAQGRGGP